jgi:hypothetical protein
MSIRRGCSHKTRDSLSTDRYARRVGEHQAEFLILCLQLLKASAKRIPIAATFCSPPVQSAHAHAVRFAEIIGRHSRLVTIYDFDNLRFGEP